MPLAELSLDVALQRGAFSLVVRERLELAGITALFGPSGSGKTTLLRIVSGLESAAKGSVRFDGDVWQEGDRQVAAHRRGVAYVFQDGRLFPHLTVAGNLGFADRRRRGRHTGTSSETHVSTRIAFDDVVAALDLAPLLTRRPTSLSGGEQQRVAIGRALLANPRLLLMDEPMSSLDARRKREILPYIEKLPHAFDLPVLYVTHSIDEAVRLASQVVLLAAGRVAARGPVAEVLERMDLWPVTGRLEAGTVVEATVEEQSAGMASLRLGEQSLRIPLAAPSSGRVLRLRIHARDVAVATERPRNLSIRNVLAASVLRIDLDESAHAELLLDVDGQHLRSRITREALEELKLEQGQDLYALVKSVAIEDRAFGVEELD